MSLVQVFWCFPEVCWIKVNTNGAASGALDFVTCGSFFQGQP